jgi:CheY-like chemotaxis protein
VPIIALTANVMPGDHELCLAAGMDGIKNLPVLSGRLEIGLLGENLDDVHDGEEPGFGRLIVEAADFTPLEDGGDDLRGAMGVRKTTCSNTTTALEPPASRFRWGFLTTNHTNLHE